MKNKKRLTISQFCKKHSNIIAAIGVIFTAIGVLYAALSFHSFNVSPHQNETNIATSDSNSDTKNFSKVENYNFLSPKAEDESFVIDNSHGKNQKIIPPPINANNSNIAIGNTGPVTQIINNKVAWRKITEEQKRSVVAHLSRFSGEKVTICKISSSPENMNFSDQIESMFKEAGLVVNSIRTYWHIPDFNSPLSDFSLNIGKNRMAFANEIGIAFLNSGIVNSPLNAKNTENDSDLIFNVWLQQEKP